MDVPDDEFPCSQRKEWGNCEEQWLIDGNYCALTCGRCTPSTPANTGSGMSSMPEPDVQDDSPYPPLNGQGSKAKTTRYWDCCKPSCGWSGKGGRIIDSCNLSGQNIGANDQSRSVCDNGDAQTCHGMAPASPSASSEVAYVFAAINGVSCGSCFQAEFTGTANDGQAGDEGTQRLKGKTMVVMATNIGDIGGGGTHFDLLIPGGGLGVMTSGCPKAFGVDANQRENILGPDRGGFRTACANAGGLDAMKQCIRDKCKTVFEDKGFADLAKGCYWYVDWFEAADNPDIVYKPLDQCPQELSSFF